VLSAEIKGKEPGKAPTTVNTSLRDDEETAACRSYQRYLLNLSLFQLKDEPEEAGIRQLRKAPFLV
jgi:hypothetical protein